MNRHSDGCSSIPKRCARLLCGDLKHMFCCKSHSYVNEILKTALEEGSNLGRKIDEKLPTNWREKVNNIVNGTDKAFSQEEMEFRDTFTPVLEAVVRELKDDEELEKLKSNYGLNYTESATLYTTFRDTYPDIGDEVVSQVVSSVIRILDRRVEQSVGVDHLDVLNKLTPEVVFKQTREFIKKKLDKRYTDSNRNNIDNFDAIKEKVYKLVEDDNVWNAVIYQAKSIFFEAEKIKLGKATSRVTQEQEQESTDITDDGIRKDNIRSEEDTREKWMKMADTIATFSSITKEARSVLYKLTEAGQDGTVAQGILGVGRAADVMYMHNALLNMVYDEAVTDSDDFVNALDKKWNTDIVKHNWAFQLKGLIEKDTTGRLKTTMFVSYYNNRLTYNHLNTRGGITYINTSSDDSIALLNEYVATMYDIDSSNKDCIFNKEGTLIDDRVARLRGYFYNSGNNVYFNTTNNKTTEAYRQLTDEEKTNIVDTFAKAFNVKLSVDEIESVVQNSFEEFLKNASYLIDGIHKGIKSKSLDSVDDLLLSDKRAHKNMKNKLRFIIGKVKKTRTVFSAASPVEKSIRYNGSTYMTSTVPNFLGDNMQRLRNAAMKEGVEGIHKYLEDNYFNDPIFATWTGKNWKIHCGWLQDIWDTTEEDLKNENSFFNKFTKEIVRALGDEDTEFKDYIESKNYVLNFIEFCNQLDRKYGRFNDAHPVNLVKMPLFVTGDSNASRFLTVKSLEAHPNNRFHDIAVHEIDKMIELEKRREVDNIGKNWNQFQYFPALNGQTFDVNINGIQESLTIDEVMKYFKAVNFDASVRAEMETMGNNKDNDEDKQQYMRSMRPQYLSLMKDIARFKNRDIDITNDAEWNQVCQELGRVYKEIKQQIGNKVDKILEDGYKEFRKQLIDNKLAVGDPNSRGSLKLKDEDQKFTSPLYKCLSFELKYENENNSDDKLDVENFLEYWYKNYKYHTIQQIQFLSVDPAFYKDTNEAQKRWKEMIASGKIFDTARDVSEEGSTGEFYRQQSVAYFKDLKVNMNEADPEFMSLLNANGIQHSSEYDGSSLTDGQAYRSFRSYRKLMMMAGADRWTAKHQKVYDIIMKARKEGRGLTIDERKEIASQNVVFQPLKLYYYGIERFIDSNGDKVNIPVQHKYAEVPLIPELLPKSATKLLEMGRFMEEKNVDLVASTACVKVGAYGAADISNGNVYDSLSSSDVVIHNLDVKNLREQNNVPEHNDVVRARGTQLTKHGYMGLSDEEFGTKNTSEIAFLNALRAQIPDGKLRLVEDEEIDLNGELTGKDMMKLWNVLGSAGFIKTFRKLTSQFGSNEDVSKMLTSMKELDTQHAPDTVLAHQLNDSGDLNIPVSELTMAMDNFASLISKFKKEVIKQGIKGGSLVQVSALGFEDVLKVNIKDGNILEVDCARPFDFSYTGFNGEQVQLDYFEYVNPETGMLLDDAGNDVEPGEGKSRLEKRFPGILDMIAYRIPTEKAYSLINLRAKRFFPKELGGTIMVPTQFTTVAGFNFEIDKLHFLAKEFKLNNSIEDTKNDQIWADYYGHPGAMHIFKESAEGMRFYGYLLKAKSSMLEKQMKAIQDTWAAVVDAKAGASAKIIKLLQDNLDATRRLKTLLEEYERGKINVPNDLAKVVKNAEKTYREYLCTFKVRTKDAWQRHNEALREKREHDMEYDRLYKYWDMALQLMKADGIDITNMPKTATEAFSRYVGKEFLSSGAVSWANTFDSSKSLLEQDQSCINNMMIDFLKFQLSDKRTFKERYTPGGYYTFKDAKGLALAMRYGDLTGLKSLDDLKEYAEREGFNSRDYKLPYDITEMSTLVHYQTWNALYDKLIGMAANQSINQRLTALMNKYELKRPIRWGSMLTNGDENSGKNLKARFIGGNDTELITTEMLAAAVDAVKDALLEFFGIDDKIFSLSCLMTRIGATPTDIALLLNQPVVQKACRKIKEKGGKIGLSVALDEVLQEEFGDPAQKWEEVKNPYTSDTKGREMLVSSDNLVLGMANQSGEDFQKIQLAVVATLKDLQTEAQHLAQQVKVTKTTSTNTISSTPGELISLILTTESIADEMQNSDYGLDIDVNGRKTIIDPALVFSGDGTALMKACVNSPFAMEQVTFSALRSFLEGSLGKYFPYFTNAYNTTLKSLQVLSKNNNISGEMIDDMLRDLPQYLLSRAVPEFSDLADPEDITLVFNGNEVTFKDICNTDVVSRRDFYNVFFPDYLMNAIVQNQKALKDGTTTDNYLEMYPILSALLPSGKSTVAKEKRTISLTVPEIGKLGKTEKKRLRDSWYRMFQSSDPLIKNLATHLFYYSYFKAGLTFSPLNLSSLVSTEILLSDDFQRYRDFYNMLFNMDTDGDNLLISNGYVATNILIQDVLKSFIRNHYKKYWQICRQELNKGMTAEITSQLGDNGTEFVVDAKNSKFKSLVSPVEYDVEHKDEVILYKFVPAIVLSTDKGLRLFICNNNDANGDPSTSANFNTAPQKITYYEHSLPSSNKDYSTPVTKKEEIAANTNRSKIEQAMLVLRKQNI